MNFLIGFGIISLLFLIIIIVPKILKKKPVQQQQNQQQQNQPQPNNNQQQAQNANVAGNNNGGGVKKSSFWSYFWKILVTVIILLIAFKIGLKTYTNWQDNRPYHKVYVLTKENPFETIPVKRGFEFECDGHKVKYYFQSEGCKKVLVGGGIPFVRQSESCSFFTISRYKKDVKVDVYFSKKKK